MTTKRKNDESTSPFKKFKNDPVRRPAPAKMNSNTDTFTFQQIELDHYQGTPVPGMPGPQTGLVPIMRMYGVTSEGNSVCCHIHGFSPYFFVSLPNKFTEADLLPFQEKLNAAVIADIRSDKDSLAEAVHMVEIFKGKSVMGYNADENGRIIKITVALPYLIGPAKRLLETTQVYPQIGHFQFTAFESKVDIEMRFLVDTNVLGCSWIEIPPGKWTLRPSNNLPMTTLSQIEIDVSYETFIAHAPAGEWSKVAPFRVHSFDIECSVRGDIFPEPKMDPVIQIANVVQLHGSQDYLVSNVFTLNTCAPIEHAEVRSFKTEEELLQAWGEFVRDVDPDIFTGYNINSFDFPYLIKRAQHLKLNDFPYLGRLKNVRSNVKETTNQRKFGNRKFPTTHFEGRILYDMWKVMKTKLKLKSYTLNNVSQTILNERKEDVHYSIITDLQNGDEQTRRRLAVYCVKDAILPLRLMNHVKSLTNDIEMARVTGVPISSLLTKGEEVKVVAQLLRNCRKANNLMPTHKVTGNNAENVNEGAATDICHNI